MKNNIMKTICAIVIMILISLYVVAVIDLSKAHIKATELEKQVNELVIALGETNATTQRNEPTRYEIASSIYNVDKYLLEAIERLETGHFTSDVFKKNNNSYGAKVNGVYLIYDNHYQSTMELARLLRFKFYNKGITDLHEIGKIYCPDDKEWADKIQKIYNELLKE